MPRARRPEYDSPEFKARYLAGETLESLGAWIGVNKASVYRAARIRGLPRRKWGAVRRAVDSPEFARRFHEGESYRSMAPSFGVSHAALLIEAKARGLVRAA